MFFSSVVGDYFAVKVTEDPFYATPIFTTIGGQSKCPGESGTTRRESRVEIFEIVPRCGVTMNRPCDEHGEPALFGVVIQNLSYHPQVRSAFINKC